MSNPASLDGAVPSAARRGRDAGIGSRIMAATLIGALCGCASSSDEIQAQYVSPMQYSGYDCQQIAAEQQRVSARVGQLAGEVDDNAAGDAVAVGVGLILFWPALFFVDGDGPEAAEYAKLKGEHEALRKAGIEKKCAPTNVASSGTGTSVSASAGEKEVRPTGRQIVVTPTVKAKIDRYVRNCESQATKYCVIAVRNDGTRVELGKADSMSATRKDMVQRTAVNSCGGPAACTIVYEGGRVQAEIVSQ